MKYVYKIFSLLLVICFVTIDVVYSQQEVTIRDLNTYETVPASQAELDQHPLAGVEVVFEAVVVSYPRNSGLASSVDGAAPGRVHLFVVDVNALNDGLDGMYMHIVDAGATREQIEQLFRGDVVEITGELDFFNDVVQFDPTQVNIIGSVNSPEFEELSVLLEPTVIDLSEINQPSEIDGLHKWVAENYTKYINRYVKLEGVEVFASTIEPNGRPDLFITDGNTIMMNRDISLRYRNDRSNYGYNPETGDGLGYNYRRESEGPFTPPDPGSVVDISGFVVIDRWDPLGLNESNPQSTLRIVPWDDGVLWVNDGDDPDDRLTPDGWPNDLTILGFAPILSNFSISPDPAENQIFNNDEVTVTVDVALPEVDYTLESVQIEYMIYPYTEDSSDLVVADMTNTGGNTYTFTFDAQDDFNTVEFQVVATASTPDGVQTAAREEGSYFVESATQTSPVVFSPPAGEFSTAISVELASATSGATIHYTLDGSTPDTDSPVYTSAIELIDSATITAFAVSNELDDSPVNFRTYAVDVDLVEVESLAELRAGAQDGTLYQFTGEAVVTYARSARNQKYLMDSSGGILIDDPNTVITSPYQIGDVMSGVIGTLGTFQGKIQFLPGANPGDPVGTADVVPESITFADLDLDIHESMLIQVENVSFVQSGEFVGGTNYNVFDDSLDEEETVLFRTNFPEVNYIGQDIPEDEFTLTALVDNFNGTAQLIARSDADFGGAVSNENDTSPYQFRLAQNYPNPFNPATRINYELAQTTDVRLVVYDILGRRVATLVNEVQNAGFHTVNFDMSRYASGTYIYRLEAGDFVSVKKMMLIK